MPRVLSFGIAITVGALVGWCGPEEPTPPTTTTTTTTLAPACSAPEPGPAGDYVGVETRPPENEEVIVAAREKIDRYRCWPEDPNIPLLLLMKELQLRGFCVVRSEDRLIVGRTDKLYEEWRPVRWDVGPYLGCWSSMARAYKGTLAWEAQ